VAMRVLASQGFIEFNVDNQSNEVTYSINSKSKIAFDLFPLYKDVVELSKFAGNFHNRVFQEEPFLRLKPLCERYKNHFGITFSDDETTLSIQKQVLRHIEGNLVGSTFVRLGMNGMFNKYFM
jgi:hypothetical protein